MALGRQLVLALLGCLLGAAGLSAQNTGTVTGRVFEGSTQEPLSGATVAVAERSGVTGADGAFRITGVPAGTHTVRATRIGYGMATRQVTVAAGQTATVEIGLSSQALQLEGMVVIGYGEQEVRDRTGSVEAVTAEEFNTGVITSPEQLIQGKVAGVQVIDTGEPGGGGILRIRGGTSVNASNEPLFVVDGVPLAVGGGISAGRNPLSFLNPQDVESVTVLKDASATAIYGSRGANGVIIIETKAGRGNEPQFTYSTSLSHAQVTGEPEMLSAVQFRQAVQQHAPNVLPQLGNANTDWRGTVIRDAGGQEHTVAAAGSREDMNYRLSLSWLDQEGVLQGTEMERASAALNYGHRLFGDRLSLRASIKGSRTADRYTPGGALGSATAFDPTQPIRTSTGAFYESGAVLAPNNPVAELGLLQDEGTTYRSVGSVEGEYRLPFLEGLSTTVRMGYDVTRAERSIFSPSTLQSQIEAPTCVRVAVGDAVEQRCARGQLERRNPSQTSGVIEAFGTYERALDAWNSEVDVTAGYSYEEARGDFPQFIASGLASDVLGSSGVPAALLVRPSVNVDENKLASFFGRVNYTLRDRYLLTLSVRRDGSSRFGAGNQWGTFPSAALAWRVSDEAFLDGAEWLSDLKLRASWGINGNQAIANYLAYSTYLLGNAQAQAQFGNEFVTTIRPGAADPDIKWEETTSYNLGVDYGFLDDRIYGSLEFYQKDTDDLIFNVPVAAGTNLTNFVTTNIGSMENRGVEFSVNAVVLQGAGGGFRWDAGFNAAYNRNRLVRVNSVGEGTEQIPTGGIAGGVGNTIQVLQPGFPVNSFFVYRHVRDASGNPVYADVNNDGTINEKDLYEDLNDDGNVNSRDRAPFESPAPDWVLGHTSLMEYGNADLSFSLRAHLGNHVYNNVASNLGHYSLLRSVAPTNLHASVLEYGFDNPQYFSDVYVEDASFLRMDNLTLGYNFRNLRQVQRLRVFGTVQNVFTWTSYSGVDPEAAIRGLTTTLGIDNNIYPRARTFSVGVNVGF
jgi:TonB-linked SusC/RagA family outer membrane protein